MGGPRPNPPWRRPLVGLGRAGVALGLLAALVPMVGGGLPAYEGAFEAARFHEDALDEAHAVQGRPLEDLFGTAGVAVLYAELPSGTATWVVHADGRVVLTGDADWPEARDAFAAWHEGQGLGAPRFGDLRVTTPDSVLDDQRSLLA